ncbi:MAG: DUF2207 domain-containing protein [Bacilli bacterium]|nr:DUF2207 domain-containing protein [Bacilli bacterium]
MKKKGKTYKYVFIFIFLFYFIPSLFMLFGIENNDSKLLFFLLVLIFSLFAALLVVLWLKMIIFVFVEPIKRVNQVRRIQNAKYIDSSDYIYVRDVPNNYTPAVASLVLDQSLEYNKDVISTTLYLINHGYLKEVEERIIVLDKDTSNLMNHELYLISVYKKETLFSSLEWEKHIINDAYHLNLITKKDSIDNKDKINLVINLAIPIMLLIGFINVLGLISDIENVFFVIFYIIGIITIPFFGLFVVIYGLMYFLSFISKDIKLTNEGLKEQEKMAKFKKFLEELSNIDERSRKDLVLWDDYLTFAVALDVNKKIYWDNEFIKKVNAASYIVQHDALNELSKLGS